MSKVYGGPAGPAGPEEVQRLRNRCRDLRTEVRRLKRALAAIEGGDRPEHFVVDAPGRPANNGGRPQQKENNRWP